MSFEISMFVYIMIRTISLVVMPAIHMYVHDIYVCKSCEIDDVSKIARIWCLGPPLGILVRLSWVKQSLEYA